MEYADFAEKCVEELKVVQDRFQRKFDLTWYENWFYDQTTGLLTFSTKDIELNFRYIDIGSFSEKSNTWKWSWDNSTTLASIKERTNLVKDFGQRSGFPKLTEGYFASDEIEAWEF